MMDQENAAFYVKRPNAIGRRIGKIKRNLRVGAHALRGLLTGDYSRRTLPLSWQHLPSRFELINRLIADCGYQHYLEIGCSTDACFQNIAAKHKCGVDPFSGGTHRMTSDAFFAENRRTFDIIFIDGLHQYAQVKKDMLNAVAALNDGGVILVHDCLPLTWRAQLPFPPGGDWNGDVWKAFVEMRTQPHVDSAVCLIDHGVGIIKKRSNRNILNLQPSAFAGLRFGDFVHNYAAWLNVIGYDAALRFAGAPAGKAAEAG